jgi:AraC-like DNA-binding protein
MLYLERKPSPPLARFIRSFWYTSAPNLPHQRERVLPNGLLQIIISLATNHLTDCGADTGEEHLNIRRPLPSAILVGARSRYDIVHTHDMAELIGIVFRPGGLGPWLRQSADTFFEQSIPLDDLWSTRELQSRLREQPTPTQKLATLDAIILDRLRGRTIERSTTIKAALLHLRHLDVSQTARTLAISDRRLRQIFQQDVGLSPKQWSRIHRFQHALSILHAGRDIRWDQLALQCGYYDQPHFSNDFRAFSGIDPTTYSTHRGPWRNHIAIEEAPNRQNS